MSTCEASKKRMLILWLCSESDSRVICIKLVSLWKKRNLVPLSALQQITKTMNLSIFLHQLPISSPLKEACVQVYQTLRWVRKRPRSIPYILPSISFQTKRWNYPKNWHVYQSYISQVLPRELEKHHGISKSSSDGLWSNIGYGTNYESNRKQKW